jgi:NTE family protein
MTRALVLGGGGPVGIAWETGLAVGLAERGVDLAVADRIVGTSAGSVVGAQLAAGLDLVERAQRVYLQAPGDGGSPVDRALAAEVDPAVGERMMQLIGALGGLGPVGAPDAGPDPALAELGRRALEAGVEPEQSFLALFAEFAEHEWPERFACTAVDTATGRFTVWERSSGIPLDRGVASSCSVPFVYPPITIGEGRYMDGGMRSALNADLATGCDAVVVVSVMADLPPGIELPMALRETTARDAHLEALRTSGSTVELVMPSAELVEISGMGMFLMDAARGPAAYQAGLRQAEVEADRLRAVWADAAT